MKIGFCFLIYDKINLEELWELFFKDVDPNKYNIYVHYKDNKILKYFEQYKLHQSECIETKYCRVSIVHAHNILFKKAYEDGCYKIISLSQACIPFKSFDYVYDFLCKDNNAHFNIAPQNACFPRCDELIQYYNKNTIQKSSNWFILNRKTCELVAYTDKIKIDAEYGNIWCPEEHYFITSIFSNNLQNEIIATPNLSNNATTFTNWCDMGYKYSSCHGLKNYNNIDKEEILYLLNSACLFGRKFNRDCYLWLCIKEYIQPIAPTAPTEPTAPIDPTLL
jgi:hypothetical protein